MTTTIVFPEIDAFVSCQSNSYPDAREGTGTLATNLTATVNYTGQYYAAPTYTIYESFLSFDTSLLADTATVSSISMSTYIHQTASIPVTHELREYDFGSTITTTDFIPGSSLGNYPLLAQISLTGADSSKWYTFGSSANFLAVSNLKTGSVRLALNSAPHRLGTAEQTDRMSIRSTEYETARVYDPYLTITWTDSGTTSATIYPAVDGHINSLSTTYATARTGGTLSVNTGNTTFSSGQFFFSPNYTCTEGFISFDTSALADDATVVGVTLSTYAAASPASRVFELRDYDFGSTLETTDWVSGANLSSYTALSQIVTTVVGGWFVFPDTPEFRAATNLKTGTVHGLIHSDTHRVGTSPTGDETIALRSMEYTGTSYDPYLTVVYTLPVVTGTALGSLGAITGTATGAITRFGTVATELGAITGTATGTVTAYGVGTSSLGGLDGSAIGTVTVAGTGQGTLGELATTGTGMVTVFGQCSGVLGAVVGTANGSSYKPGVGVGLLGGVTGTAVGTSLTIVYGYGGSVLGGILGQSVAEAQTMENVILIGGGTRNSVVASDNDAILRSAVRSGIA